MHLTQELDHPNVACAFDAGVADGVHYIALEYVPGKTLSQTVASQGALDFDIAARTFVEAADGLAHAHKKGIIHRDLKPSNLMITPAGHAKLLDVGLALRAGETGDIAVLGGKGIVVGTMDYVPPEQTRDAAAVDERSDLYGLGATLFYSLTGRPPFPGGSGKEKIARHRREEPPRVDEYNADVPDGMVDLVSQLLSKEPADRPGSAAEVRDRLLKWAAPPASPNAPMDVKSILRNASMATSAETDSTSETQDTGNRKWLWLALAAITLLILIIVIVRVRNRSADKPPPAEPAIEQPSI